MTTHSLHSLRYRALHRGMKETDLLMERFVKDHLDVLCKEEVENFAQFIQESDQDILAWVMSEKETPVHYVWIVKQMQKNTHVL